MCIESILYSCCVAKVNENFEDRMLFGSGYVKSCVSQASTIRKKGMVEIDHALRVFRRLPQSQRLQFLTSTTTCQTH